MTQTRGKIGCSCSVTAEHDSEQGTRSLWSQFEAASFGLPDGRFEQFDSNARAVYTRSRAERNSNLPRDMAVLKIRHDRAVHLRRKLLQHLPDGKTRRFRISGFAPRELAKENTAQSAGEPCIAQMDKHP